MCRSTLTLVLLFTLATLTSTASSEPLSDDEVFAQVFAARPARAQLPVLLVVADQREGSIVVERTASDARVPAAPVLTALDRARLLPDIGRKLASLARGGRLSLADLRSADLGVELDEQRLELRIAVPAALTTTTSHRFGPDGAPPEAATALRPSDVSGRINLLARTATDAPDVLQLDGATTAHGWVLEARGEIVESFGVRRGDVRLTHDVPASALRYLAGDFAIAGSGLQPALPILGVGVTRNFALQPYRRIQPVGVFHFVLETPASVTIVVNGSPVQTLQLPAGRHDVRDLPGVAGISDIELLVRDQSGIERRLEFSTVAPGELLASGVVQFSVGMGVPLLSETGLRDYAWSRPILSARRRWGVSNRLTVGFSGDVDFTRQVGGAAVAMASTLGNLSVDVHASRDQDAGRGAAGAVRYDLALADGTTLMIAGRAYSSTYRSLGILDLDGAYRGDVAVAGNRRLAANLIGRANLRYQVGRMSPDAHDASLGLMRSFGDLLIDATVGVRDTAAEPRDFRVLVAAQWQLPGRRGIAHGMSRTSSRSGHSNSVRVSSMARPTGGLVASAGVTETSSALGADGSLSYIDDRFTASVTGGTMGDRALGQGGSRASAEVGTALAFAGGRVAWSRPIQDSFVIVDRDDAIANVTVGVNPVAGHDTARADGFGPAVVQGYVPYLVGTVRVAAPSLPLGMSLGEITRVILPGYQSGTLVVVGEPGTVYLRGKLRHADGSPAALVVGELVAETAPQAVFDCANVETIAWQDRLDCYSETINRASAAKSWVVMTNRTGRFSVVGMSPGRYTLRLPDARPIEVVIPVGHAGVYTTEPLTIR